MSSLKKTFGYPWSRLKNGLVELQRWWPAYVKNDSTNGLSVDPVLYTTDFGPNTRSMEGSLEDESNTPGVRVECVNDDGTAPQQDYVGTNAAVRVSTSTDLVVNNVTGCDVWTAWSSAGGGSGTIVNNGGGTDTFTYTGTGATTASTIELTGVTINSTNQGYSVGNAITATGGDAVVTVEISGSGGYSPKCKIIDTDGRIYEFYLIAPSGEGVGGTNKVGDSDTIQSAYGITQQGSTNWRGAPGSPQQAKSDVEGSMRTSGPYPVFMTVQEFAEMLDTYRHIGKADNTKPAWLPHGMVGRVHDGVAALPSFEADPRLSNTQDLPTDWRFRSTVFMPMMLDNNQFDKRTTGASVSFAWPQNTEHGQFTGYALSHNNDDHTGLTRYPTDPDTSDSNRKWKELGYSGDHLHGAVGAWSQMRNGTRASADGGSTVTFKAPGTSAAADIQTTIGLSNPDISLDTSASIGPKYRMRMALAAFLKDGTYTVSGGGAIIPYIYDATRTIGGTNTDTLYAVWDGKNGHGNSQGYADDCSAQIYPMFDFVQGPIAPASQGNNFDASVTELEVEKYKTIYGYQSTSSDNRINPRQFLVRPNPQRIPIVLVEKTKLPAANALSTQLRLYLDSTSQTFVGGFGMPVYITGMEGNLGTGAVNLGHQKTSGGNWVWDSNNTKGSWYVGGSTLDHNGWWIIRSVSEVKDGTSIATLPDDYQEVVISINYQVAATVAAYDPGDNAYLCQGRLGGYENVHDSHADAPMNLYGIEKQIDMRTVGTASFPGTGSGFFAGPGQPDCNVPVGGSLDSTYPGRPTIWKPGVQNSSTNGYDEGTRPVMRSIEIWNATQTEPFTLAPPVSNKGGGVLRIPPPIGWDIAFQYYSGSENYDDPDVIWSNTHSPDFGKPDYTFQGGAGLGNASSYNRPNRAGNDRWGFRGVSMPFWSYMDGVKGRHAWDYIKPDGWSYGRNRPWPGHERVGTRVGYQPTPSNSTDVSLTEWSASPVWLDMTMTAFIPVQQSRLVMLEFDNNIEYQDTGKHSMFTHGGTNNMNLGHGFYPLYDGAGYQNNATISGCWMYGGNHDGYDTISSSSPNRPPVYTANRPAIYAWGTQAGWFTAGWNESENAFPIGNIVNNNGWGALGGGSGYGTASVIGEGTHEIRTVFTNAGMTYILDGNEIGTDPNSGTEMWGMVIKVGDAFGVGGAEPYNDGTWEVNNVKGERMFAQNPNYNPSQKDLQIDSITLRQIPTNSMLPFNVDTVNQKLDDVKKYTSLQIEADNISESKGMRVKVSIMVPPSKVGGTIEQEATTAYAGFDNLDPGFIGGIGSVNLTDLPASAITNGFMVRFHFYIPDNTQTDMHPIDWASLPIVRSWTLKYDTIPTATLACIGNTFDGDTTSPIGTKVGHVISFRATGETTDADRTVASVKFDFGDGEQTGFINFADQTLQSTTLDVAHVYTKAGTFSVTAITKDDNGNESTASSALSVVVAETKPVAVLRATPALLQAGSAVTFDASSSYIVSSDASRTIATYTFTPGDGTSATTQASSTFSHTYASAGEYSATLTCTDNASSANTSTASSCVIKVTAADATTDLMAALNTKPNSFKRTERASMSSTTTLDGTYPEVRDLGQRNDDFTLSGTFLKATADADITTMEGYMSNGTLVTIKWQTVDYSGNASVKTFVGRMTSFDYQREGGKHGETPWSARFRREE